MTNKRERSSDPLLEQEVHEILQRLRAAFDQPDDGSDHAGPGDILSQILRERDNRIRALEERLTPKPLMRIAERLVPVFHWLEQWDLKVGDIWLHPRQVAELAAERDPQYDKIASRDVRNSFMLSKGVPYVGVYCGARVFASEIVLENHVVAVPDGLDAKVVDKAACIPF